MQSQSHHVALHILLHMILLTDDATLKADIEQRALTIALQYNFVTELTSLIVVQEDGTNLPPQEQGQNNPISEIADVNAAGTVTKIDIIVMSGRT